MNLEYWLEQQLKGNDVALDLTPEQQDLHGLTLMDAIKAHAAWIEKLELTLKGKNPEEYDPDIVGADHLCKLGTWLHGNGAALNKFKEYGELLEHHKQFHTIAGGIIRDHKRGKFADAIRALRHDLIDLSKTVKTDLVKLLLAYHRG